MLSNEEIEKVAKKIVAEAKRTANYEQGTLFRSISYTFIRGLLTFRQIFYGQYNNNSQLEIIARRKVPRGVPYQIVLTDFDRSVESKSRIRQGTASNSSVLKTISSIVSSVNIKALIERNKAKRKKEEEQ